MVTEVNRDVEDDILCYENGTDEDYQSVIKNLYNDKLKLLKEQKMLYLLLADKDEQILKFSEMYKNKWCDVCERLQCIERLCCDVEGSDEKLSELRIVTTQLLNSTSSQPNMDTSVSSYFTATDTGDSNMSSSSESIVAKHNNDTLTKFTGFQSLNNLVNENSNYKSRVGDDFNHLIIDEQEARSHSDCVQDPNDLTGRRHCVETDTSESLFRAPDNYIRRSKKLTKKASTKNSEKVEAKPNLDKKISEFTNQEVYSWLLNVARLPKFLVEDIKIKNKINGQGLENLTEQRFDKLFGTSDKIIKRKVFLALEEYKSGKDKGYKDNDLLTSKDHIWVANVWLKRHLGLMHLCAAFLSRCVDGRLLHFIATSNHARMKELIQLATVNFESSSGVSATPITNVNKAIYEPSKSDLRSLRFGLQLFMKFEFHMAELEERRRDCEDLDKDVLVWTNERFAKWFQHQDLKNYIRGIEYSGIHGAMMVLDSQFSVATMSKLLQMPPEVVKKNNLADKFSTLLKPSRFNEGVKSRRSTSIFRRRSLSQPRFPKNKAPITRTSNVTPDMSDSASNNDSATARRHSNNVKEKCHTIDLSHSPSRNKNFVRTYRKPDHLQLKSSVTDNETEASTPSHHFSKSPPGRLQAFQMHINRKLNPKSRSGSEEEDDCEV